MGEERSAIQKFIRQIQAKAPERYIEVSLAIPAKRDGKDVLLAGKPYGEADQFLDDVEAKKPVHVHVRDLGNFTGSPDEILAAVGEATAE